MKKEIIEYVISQYQGLINDMLEITDRDMLSEEEEAWREEAEQLNSYADQHFNLSELLKYYENN